MREAQKMMNDPKFQEQMKKVTESQGFKAWEIGVVTTSTGAESSPVLGLPG